MIGYGYWGKNLARDFNALGVLKAVSDINNKAEKEIKKMSGNITYLENYKVMLRDQDITSVAIATPAKSHYKIVRDCIISKKHVFVEKPLCLNYKDGKKLVLLAKKYNVKLMVGHLMLYHRAFKKMIETIKKDKIQETSTLKLLKCFLGSSVQKEFCNEDFLSEIIPTLTRRFITPFYIPVISLISALLLLRSNKIILNKNLIFFYSFSLLLFTEIAVKFTGQNIYLTAIYTILPLILIFLFYFFLKFRISKFI